MRFATTLTLLSALILSGSSVLAIPVPATDAFSDELTSVAARELSYESSVDARAFDLEERGLRSGLRKLKNRITGGGTSAAPAELERRAFEFDALLEGRGLRSGLRKLKNRITGGGTSAAPAELEGRELEDELLERGEGKTSTRPYKGGGVSSRYRRSLSAADLRRRREELEQRDIRMALRNLSLRRRELERNIVERSRHGSW
ncbi:hypothetical protein D9611_005498 [Ephemerocybe angulata]|uniref:Uncharacterized protein n=1 Tax=Ephemerocybe angulata TaxID=980116 RepID=A0A8H5FDM2_9AGAR|nr:hypothetical protein D9611_005498 [Tulosesus angulatus]